MHYRDGRRMALCGRYGLRVVVRRAGAVGPAAILVDGLDAGPMTAATLGCCPALRRPGELLTRGDVCHVHADRAATEQCGVLLGGAPELVRLDEVRPTVYRVAWSLSSASSGRLRRRPRVSRQPWQSRPSRTQNRVRDALPAGHNPIPCRLTRRDPAIATRTSA